MPDLNFHVESADPVPFAAVPTLAFKLRVAEAVANGAAPTSIHAVALRCQIRIEPTRRHYESGEQDALIEVFGRPSDWSRSLRSMLWTHASVIVPAFTSSTTVDLPVPCTFDFNIAATKYFAAIEDGDVPISFYFSGTVFYRGVNAPVQAGHVSWEKEATHRMPIKVWLDMMDAYYPNTSWLCLQRDAFNRLLAYKTQHGIPTFEQTLITLLDRREAAAR